MLYIKPDYYDTFSCVADQCEDTCCAGWKIVVDEDSLKRYKAEKGPFRKELHKGIHWRSHTFHQKAEKRCFFLDEDNLCRLYSALGEGMLCQTCDRYPRHIEEFENVREVSLSLSCPEVARYLVNRQELVHFLSEETEEEENYQDYEDMDFDLLLYDILDQAREVLLSILQNRQESMKDRLHKALHMTADLESLIEEGNAFSAFEIFDSYQQGEISYKKRHIAKAMPYSMKVFDRMIRLERLREDWEMLLSESASLLYLSGEEKYEKDSEEFIKWCRDKDDFLEIVLEQLAVYYMTTYFCGSVYDGRILAKIQSTILFLYVIFELSKAAWLKNEKNLDTEDITQIVYRFSRELEHSDRNLDLFEKIAAAALPIRKKHR